MESLKIFGVYGRPKNRRFKSLATPIVQKDKIWVREVVALLDITTPEVSAS